MGSLSEDRGGQILQKAIDALIIEVKDTREQLLQTEDRLETKIRDLIYDVETKEAKHQEEIVHLTEKIKELHGKIGNESVGGVTDDDEFKDCIDLEGNSSLQLTDGFIENEPDSSDTGRNNQTGRSALDSGNINSERSNSANLLSIQPHSQFSMRFTRLLGSDETNTMHTSESFHMHSAATISDPSNNCGKVWSITITSVVITTMQFLILYTLIIEANSPTCASHQDCLVGKYCDYDTEHNWKWTPRCSDCSYINEYTQANNISNCSSVLDGYKDMSHTDYADVDHIDIAWKVNFDYTEFETFCFAQLHCDETDLLEDRCDYIVNQINKWHGTQVATLIFMSLLLAVLISRDVQDAIAEERYLNHGLKRGSINPSSQLAAEVLRMALRARQIVIPWYAAAAAVSIIITDTLDTKNIMLDLLTIDVILIADDLLATLFLPLLDQTSTEKLMKSASRHKVKVSMVWSRIHGITVAITLVLTVRFIEPLLISFSPSSYATCSEIIWALDIFILISPLCITFLHGVGHIVLDRKSATKCKAVMRGIGEIILDLASYACFCPLASYIIAINILQFDVGALKRFLIGAAYLFCFISFEVLKLYTSWPPIQVLSLNLFGM